MVKEGFVLEERRISLSEFHTADEVFMASLIYSPRIIRWSLTKKIVTLLLRNKL